MNLLGRGLSMFKSMHPNQYKILREHLVRIRKEADLTQVELARKLGIKQQVISKIEQGERQIDVLEFIEICKACAQQPETVLKCLK